MPGTVAQSELREPLKKKRTGPATDASTQPAHCSSEINQISLSNPNGSENDRFQESSSSVQAVLNVPKDPTQNMKIAKIKINISNGNAKFVTSAGRIFNYMPLSEYVPILERSEGVPGCEACIFLGCPYRLEGHESARTIFKEFSKEIHSIAHIWKNGRVLADFHEQIYVEKIVPAYDFCDKLFSPDQTILACNELEIKLADSWPFSVVTNAARHCNQLILMETRPSLRLHRTLLDALYERKLSQQIEVTLNLRFTDSMNELFEELKKILGAIPLQVAEKLKLGQAIDPETFDSVTVFFSDVVSFTTLASKCTPLQVVNLLNNLYTTLDSIIGEFDVYKVETIGDGYLCVSGLPHRNGNEHARHVANMSLAIMRSLVHFSISHLPGEKLKMRIGLHTGPCVAGVVGLSMPRYCLFGDTVNTASRMESNSKPMMIHLSASTNHCLTNVLGGFVTQSRGEVIIKGKGVMETFWLLGVEGDPTLPKEVSLAKDMLNETAVAPTPPVPEFTVRRHGNDTQLGSTRRDSSGIPNNKWL
ncbi:adenylate and guanylate cyclase catalytic domain-containing protein [Ditylenchus destructor]|nr:adenylate and guanylate cyclase catalytic domain-containing protein [Ditylenchus destructor]